MLKIIIDDKIPFIHGILEPFAEVIYLPGNKIDHKIVKNADALIIRTRTICNKDLLEGSSVKFIVTATIGYDHIDTKWCEATGIIWKNAEGCNSSSVMQYVASNLSFLSKKHHFKFEDRTLGVIGVGNVGKKVVRLAEALGMRVVLNDPPIVRSKGLCGYISLDGILREADIITLHVPLINNGEDRTFHLFDEAMLKRLRPGTILINSSRGEVVDNIALKNFIKTGKLEGAVLDVWENEPDIDKELMKLLDIATPHIAGYSADGKANGTSISVMALNNFFRFGLKEWFPHNILAPQVSEIKIDAKDKTEQFVICEAIEHTYKVIEDNERLKNSPDDFELQRGNYPLRREFQAYTIELKNGNSNLTSTLRRIGFNLRIVK
jgi:erythronate-4-phosphate dehydrogenase